MSRPAAHSTYRINAMQTGFVHLGARSEFSSGESLARVDHLCRVAAQNDQEALALTDVMSLAGAPGFDASARLLGVQPILGLEVRLPAWGQTGVTETSPRVRLLAAEAQGWRRLVQLVNLGRTNAAASPQPELPFITWDDLTADPRGLFYLLGGARGETGRSVLENRVETAEAILGHVLAAVPRSQIFVALPNPTVEIGRKLARTLSAVAAHYELPAVAVPEIHAALPEDDLLWRLMSEPHEGLKHLGDLARPQRTRRHLAPTQDIEEWYGEFPEAVDNAAALAALCKSTLPEAGRRFPVHAFERGVDAESFIWNEVFSRAAERYGDLPARWRERLNREFRDLMDAGLADGLVCLARLESEFQDRGVLRGPGAGFLTNSLVASLLGITRVDPLRFDLPFTLPESAIQRFPAMELSVPDGQRDEAARALSQLFQGHSCAVGRWKRWATSAALDQVLEVLGETSLKPSEITKRPGWKSAYEAMAMLPPGEDPAHELPLNSVEALAWLTRHLEGRVRTFASVPNQFTFSVDHIDGAIPRFRSPEGGEASQWDAEALEARGYGRVSLTHQPLLDLMHEAAHWVRLQGNRRYDPTALAHDDAETFHLLRQGQCAGIHVLEPPRLRRRLRHLQPSDLASLQRVISAPDSESPQPGPAGFDELLLAYACSGIKAHEPGAFYAAALSQNHENRRATHALLDEARLRGLEIRPLDINFSTWRWAPEDNALRPGLMTIRGLPQAAARELEDVRHEMTYHDLTQLLRRTDPRVLKTGHIADLIRAGALDSFGNPRRASMERLLRLTDLLRPSSRARNQGEPLEFFGQDTEWWLDNHVFQEEDDAHFEEETLEWLAEEEHAVTGLVFCLPEESFHEAYLQQAHAVGPHTLELGDENQVVTLVGRADAVETPDPEDPRQVLCEFSGCLVTATGARADFLKSDRRAGQLLLVTGSLRRESFQWILEATQISDLETCANRSARARGLEVGVQRLDEKKLRDLLALLKRHPGDTPLRLTGTPEEPTRLHQRIASRRVAVCPMLEVELNRLVGPRGWQLHIPGDDEGQVENIEDEETLQASAP